MQERIDMQGKLTLRLTDSSGQMIQERQYHNRIVTTGRQLVAQLFGGIPGTPPTKVTHIGVGTDNTSAKDDQVGLLAERAPRKPISEVSYSDVIENPGTPNEVRRVKASLTAIFDFNDANGSAPLQEAAIFTADTGGIMYNRVVFEPVTKTSAFKLTLLWDIIF
ncbi:hypothetical protein K9N68_03650 [Kovacikia minuta CCNUW1]|uniref:hypothetical protein n=1 Tax=Kovacikia minuta TaxID=2931930 RepID=UPI001CC9AC85|nr:hypothetical protein [Kovacikia minuta]UBF27077.1 hypothetical protein K9N68_03650 [Kovacikia minuta CCNUW1]